MDKRSSEAAKAKRAETMLARHGVASAMQSKDVVEKANASKLAKFGSMKPPGSGKKRMTLEEFVARAREIHGDKYDYSRVVMAGTGVKVEIICPDHGVFLQTPAKHLQGRGCTHKDCIAAKKIATNRVKFGVDNPMQSSEIVEKLAVSNLNKHGVDNPMKLPEVQAKVVATNMDKYQVPYTCMAEPVKAKREAALTAKYGGNSPMCSRAVRGKAESTMLGKYQARHALQSDICRAKAAATLMSNWGVENPMFSKEIRRRVVETKRAHHTECSSGPEDALHALLLDYFGSDDVVRYYWSDEYPHECDFYIKSRDMYIELNGDFSHGMHWYDENNLDDKKALYKWIAAKYSENLTVINGKTRYDNAISVWSKKDPEKRADAAKNNLNYIVFWDCELRDAALWFVLGCPDGHDWEHEYSWLPERDITGIDLNTLPELSGNHADLSLIAKAYQFHVFYEREERVWQENARVRNGLPVQVFLYHNRLKYKKSAPGSLSDLQLMRAFTVSGILKGYTVFDTRLMDEAVKKYDIKSVYDPCAGWGERGLYCRANGMKYLGVDVNDKLFPGYDAMRIRYDMAGQEFVHADSACVSLSGNYDAVLTCPPYGNIEIYSDAGAENLDSTSFLGWWQQVVENSLSVNPRYFCFQVNKKWRDSMLDIVINSGFELVDELFYGNDRVSHLNRKKNGVKTKHESESMLVLRRV